VPAEPAKPEANKAAAGALPDKAPAVYKVNMDTSKGMVVMECQRPGRQRRRSLLRPREDALLRRRALLPRHPRLHGQFGINGTPMTDRLWADANILDDRPPDGTTPAAWSTTEEPARPTRAARSCSSTTATTAGWTRRLHASLHGDFRMEAVDQFWAGYGEAPDQTAMHAQGNAYLTPSFPISTTSKRDHCATVVRTPPRSEGTRKLSIQGRIRTTRPAGSQTPPGFLLWRCGRAQNPGQTERSPGFREARATLSRRSFRNFALGSRVFDQEGIVG